MCPWAGMAPTNVVLSGVCVSMTPMQFGPITRSRERRAISTTWRSSAAPSVPTSRKPPEMITTALTPRWLQACTSAGTPCGGNDEDGQLDRIGHGHDSAGSSDSQGSRPLWD